MPGDSTRTVLAGGTIVTPDERIERGAVHLDGSRIAAVTDCNDVPAEAIDVTGQYVLPGFVDIHGDDIEHHLAPRPAARVRTETAVRRADVGAVSAGITTKLHAIAFEDVPDDVRSIDVARDVCDVVRNFGPDTGGLVDHRLHVRCELADERGIEAAMDEVCRGVTLVSLVEHVPGEGQYRCGGGPDGRYRTDGASPIDARGEVPAMTRQTRARRVTRAARSGAIPVASHDDPTPTAAVRASELGADICEFPLTLEAARAAGREGMTVAVGAPNVARGRSLYGNLDARRAVTAGVVDVLCSDFRPRSLLESVFVDGGSLTDRVARITATPADALGMENRGRLRRNGRGDIVVVDPDPVPTVSRVFVAGREVYRVDR